MNQLVKPPSEFEAQLTQYVPQIAAVLPSHITPDKFRRVIVTAVNLDPDLLKADRRSLFVSCVRAAQDGLLPDGREAALVIFNKKNKKTGQYEKAVQYLPMVFGVLKRMRNSGDINSIVAYVVNQNDEFTYELGDDPKIIHKPAMREAGQPIAAYAIAKLANGEVQREVMTVDEIEKARAVSRAKDSGPWVAWWGEMAKKTVIKRLSKRLPLSSELEQLVKRDEEAYEAISSAPQQHLVGAPRPTREQFTAPEPEPPEPEPAEDPLADFSGEHPPQEPAPAQEAAPEPAHDAETGEVRESVVPTMPVPDAGAPVKQWQNYRDDLMAAVKTAPDATWLTAFQEYNHDGMAQLAEDFPRAAEVLRAQIAGRAAELGA